MYTFRYPNFTPWDWITEYLVDVEPKHHDQWNIERTIVTRDWDFYGLVRARSPGDQHMVQSVWPQPAETRTCKNDVPRLEARGGERKLAGLPVVCCWCCCCWCCCCRCCAGRCCAGCSAGAGSSAAAAAGAGWSAAAAAAAALGMLLLLLPPLGGLLLLLLVLLLLLPLLRWALQMLGVLQLLGGPAHRAQGGVEPRGGGGGP